MDPSPPTGGPTPAVEANRGDDSAAFERLLARLSTRFIDLPADQIDAHIEELLGAAAEHFGLDRSTVSQGLGVHPSHRVTHRWFRAALEPQPMLTGTDLPWFAERLGRGETIVLPDVTALPDEAGNERALVARLRQQSMLLFPLRSGGAILGAVGFATVHTRRDWTPEIMTRLGLVAEIVASALARKHSELALRRSLEDNERLRRQLAAENLYLRAELDDGAGDEDIVGRSAALRAVLHQVDQVAATDAPVLLTGETGTGKELFARAIHARSQRHERTLIAVNCAALPATLIESELFGHERGAFTGASQAKPGRFELANGGTLFLDEIGDLEPALQVKLLRVLQDGEVQRIGAERPRQVDVRIIAATNRNLREAIGKERFRPDLYYRLSVFPIELPPLRERREDVPLLVWYFIQSRQRPLGRAIERVPTATMNALMAYDWPGNVRELENVIERAMILSRGPVLEVSDAVLRGESVVASRSEPIRETLADNERAHLRRVLESCGWTVEGRGQAAERLGLKPSTLRHRMRKLGLTRPTAS